MGKPYPWYYAVNDRPVKIVLLADGGVDCLVFDFVTGGFVVDRGYFGRIMETGVGNDVDQLTKEEFEKRVEGLRRGVSEERQASRIVWRHTADAEFPYEAEIKGSIFTIRVNDFPDEPLYTLMVGDVEVEDLEDWPVAWVMPRMPKALLDLARETPGIPGELVDLVEERQRGGSGSVPDGSVPDE